MNVARIGLRRVAPALLGCVLGGLLAACPPPPPSEEPSEPGEAGDACDEDAPCEEGLLCEDEVCLAPPTAERGAEGGLCYPNGTCDEALVCQDERCVLDPSLGTEGNACFPNGTCNEGLSCEADVCVAPVELPGRDEPCLAGTCAEGLVCVDAGDGDLCRLRCTEGAMDPCGEGSRCQRLEDETRACLPASSLGEPCPCDDGLVCVARDGASTCHAACDPAAGEPNPACLEGEECAAFAGGGGGACVP